MSIPKLSDFMAKATERTIKKDKTMLKIIELFKKKKRKIITLNYRGKVFAIRQPKHSIWIVECGDYYNVAIDGKVEISWKP